MSPRTLTGYFDAGTQRGILYVAGYIAFRSDWPTFNRKWRGLLRRNDLPYFHMTDYVARKGPYKDWSPAKRLSVMKRIVTLATETVRFGVGATLLLDDYARLDDDLGQYLPDPYGLCLTTCIAKVARELHRGNFPYHVDYVFESGDAGQGSVRVALEKVFATPDKRKQWALNTLTFGEKAAFPGLQLADLVAFETGRYARRVVGRDAGPERKSFQILLERIPHFTPLFDFDELTKVAEKQRQRRQR